MAEWSYALRRIRILFCVGVAIGVEGGGLPSPPLSPSSPCLPRLLNDLGDDARADGTAALANGEPQALGQGGGLEQRDLHLDVVPRPDRLGALGEVRRAGHVRRAEV